MGVLGTTKPFGDISIISSPASCRLALTHPPLLLNFMCKLLFQLIQIDHTYRETVVLGRKLGCRVSSKSASLHTTLTRTFCLLSSLDLSEVQWQLSIIRSGQFLLVDTLLHNPRSKHSNVRSSIVGQTSVTKYKSLGSEFHCGGIDWGHAIASMHRWQDTLTARESPVPVFLRKVPSGFVNLNWEAAYYFISLARKLLNLWEQYLCVFNCMVRGRLKLTNFRSKSWYLAISAISS